MPNLSLAPVGPDIDTEPAAVAMNTVRSEDLARLTREIEDELAAEAQKQRAAAQAVPDARRREETPVARSVYGYD